MSQWGQTARDNPLKSAAIAAGAVATGVFLWSKRNEISNQISELSDQIADWTNEMRNGGSSRELALTEGPNESSAIESSRSTPRSAGSRSRSTRSANQANQTTGGRSLGENTTI